MTRKEEIWNQALISHKNCYADYVNGAEWADEHPKKGLVNIKNVCKWLKENASGYSRNDLGIEYMINELKQAMTK